MLRRARWKTATAVTAAMFAMSLSACSSSDEDSGQAAEKPEKLVVWTYFTSDGQLAALKKQNEIWDKAHPDIKIEHVQIPFDQLPSKLLATATTGDGPDVILDNVVVDFPTLAAAGVLEDLTPYWDKYSDKDQFPDSALWTAKDKIYNVMSYTNLLGLYYNQDILSEYNIQPPTTVEEFTSAMAKVAAGGKYTPLAESGAPTVEGAWMFMPLLLGNKVDYCNLEGDQVAAAFGELSTWAQKKYVPKETATWDQADAWQAFMTGKYAFGINGNWNLADVTKAKFTTGTTQFPAGPDGSHVFPGGEGIAVGATSKYKDLAWEYIQTAWMSKDASLINFIESGQIPTRADLASDPTVTGNKLVGPFIKAAAETSAWPKNEQTAKMQEAIGQAASAVISGQKTGDEAASEAIEGVKAAREKGGGGC